MILSENGLRSGDKMTWTATISIVIMSNISLSSIFRISKFTSISHSSLTLHGQEFSTFWIYVEALSSTFGQ